MNLKPLGDRVLLQRERNYSKNAAGYILSKMLALGAVSLIQDVIYLSIGNSILEVREMFLPYLLWMFLTSLCGVSIGLLVSSLVRDAKTALNIIPLILIPQIIILLALIAMPALTAYQHQATAFGALGALLALLFLAVAVDPFVTA